MRTLAKGLGVLIIIAAVIVWLTLPYDDFNPLRGDSPILNLGSMVTNILNWIIVCLIAAPGAALYAWGNNKKA